MMGITLAVMRMSFFRRSGGAASSASFRPRPSIAVLGFKNLSRKPEQDWVSAAIAEMLGAEFASGQKIRVIPSENISRLKRDLSLTPGDTLAQDTLTKIHNQLGTDMVASGSFLILPAASTGKLRIVLQVQDAHTGETIATITEDGTESDLPELISAGGDKLRQNLGIGSLSANAAREVRTSVPANSNAERLYAEGLARLRRFDFLAARELFEKAIASDPNHALSHSALAESLSRLGYDSNAQVEAKKALDLASNLSREDRLSIEGRYRELNREHEAAVDIYRALYNFFPDNIDYGLRLARAQTRANRASDALETIATLRKLAEPVGTDPRLDLEESSAAERLGDMKGSQKAAASAIARADALGSRLLVAEAFDREAWAWSNLGEFDKAIDDESRAHRLYTAVGDTYEAAFSIHAIGIYQQHKGDFAGARRSLETALGEFRRVGAQWDIASCTDHLGELFQEIGDLVQARTYFEESLQIFRALNDKRGVAADLDYLSDVQMSVGQLALAQKMKEEALQNLQDIGDKRGASIIVFDLGEVLYQRGNLGAAREKYQQAIASQRQISYKTGVAYSLVGLAEVQTAQDELGAALASVQESVTIREETKEETNLAECNVRLAVIAKEQGKPANAESLARRAVAVFEEHKATASASVAYAVLASSLIAQARTADARAAAKKASSFALRGPDHIVRMQAGLASAEVEIESGKVADAEGHLDALHQQAKQEGYVVDEFEARFLLAKAQLKSGNITVARASLDKLQSEARAKGFLLVARKAEALHPH
jgi:tetratricopeptide (TPR) repeat protein